MALPSLSKVWHITANNTLVPQGSATAMARLYMLRLKQILTGSSSLTWSGGPPPAPFTVVGSSNGVTAGMDGVDRWNSTSDIIGDSGNGPRSWIVLRSTSIAANFQVLLHCNSSYIIYGLPIVEVSENAGYTGGSTTAPPTATDSQALMSAAYITSANDQQRQLHGWISSDGQCVRIVEMQQGWTQAFWLLDKPNNPVAGWPRPWIARVSAFGFTSATSNAAMAYSQFYNVGFAARGNGPFTAFGTGEGSNNLWAANGTLSFVANSFSGEFPLWPMGIASTTPLNIGRHGTVADLWWKPMGMVNGDSFPADVATKQLVCVGDIVLPWTGDSTSFMSS